MKAMDRIAGSGCDKNQKQESCECEKGDGEEGAHCVCKRTGL